MGERDQTETGNYFINISKTELSVTAFVQCVVVVVVSCMK
jgi:hypothetical protein